MPGQYKNAMEQNGLVHSLRNIKDCDEKAMACNYTIFMA